MTEKPRLTIASLKEYAGDFCEALGNLAIPQLFGATDGKAVGTFVELAFTEHLAKRFAFTPGNAASGIDFPTLQVDLKVTSAKQPQSSSPFRNATQKVYGLGYHLLVFVYEKSDNSKEKVARLRIARAVFIDSTRTADYQTTAGIRELLSRRANVDDIDGFLEDRQLPVDESGRRRLAERIIQEPPVQGVLTISNALQWRLQYGRALTVAGSETGVDRIV